MQIDVLTIFPDMFNGVIGQSIIKRAQEKNIVNINVYDIRNFSSNKHHSVDDTPFGGGAGMVMQVQPVHSALQHVTQNTDTKPLICLMCPRGKVLDQRMVEELSKEKNLIFIAGHYEGYDERIRDYCDMEISVGDFILTGGELPALVTMDAVIRLLPGVLGDDMSNIEESFSENLLEYPHYTRPREYLGKGVPEVLFSGNHAEINRWRRKAALRITLKRRPDIFEKHKLTVLDEKLLLEIHKES